MWGWLIAARVCPHCRRGTWGWTCATVLLTGAWLSGKWGPAWCSVSAALSSASGTAWAMPAKHQAWHCSQGLGLYQPSTELGPLCCKWHCWAPSPVSGAGLGVWLAWPGLVLGSAACSGWGQARHSAGAAQTVPLTGDGAVPTEC